MKKNMPLITLAAALLCICIWQPADAQASGAQVTSEPAVLLFGIGMHIEPMGTTHQGYRSGVGDYNNPDYFNKHVENIQLVADMVARHKGRMTIQSQTPFTDELIESKNKLLSDLAKDGHEIALHFHEDAHLGKKSEALDMNSWCETMQEEIGLIRQASGVNKIRYWSGGNLYPSLFKAADCAGLDVNSDWKNPETQNTDLSVIGIHPWRPAGGTDGKDLSEFVKHDPKGKVVFLPEGQFDRGDFAGRDRSKDSGGDKAYFEYLAKSLQDSLALAEADKVNVSHFTVHPGEFLGNPKQSFLVMELFLKEVVDPLVAQGKVKWATFSEMADAYMAWEATHPGEDMR